MIESLQTAAALAAGFAADPAVAASVEQGADLLANTIRAGGKVLVAGNGGSLCDAAHFAEEMTGRFRNDRPPLPAIALADPGHLTCVANDYGFDEVFARAVLALARPGDALILLSTSGRSRNLLRALEAAHQQRVRTLALLGRGGGALSGRCDVEILAPGDTADRIQELHMLVLHTWVELVEKRLGHA